MGSRASGSPGNASFRRRFSSAQLLPTATIIVPLYIALSALGLINTYFGLILVYLIITLPLCVWMLIGYFRAIPVDLEEAAIIDGASRVTILLQILLPLSLPGIVAVAVYSFVVTWKRIHLRPGVRDRQHGQDAPDRTVRVLIGVQRRLGPPSWRPSAVMTIPVALLFLAMQKPVHRRTDIRRDEGLTGKPGATALPRRVFTRTSTAEAPSFLCVIEACPSRSSLSGLVLKAIRRHLHQLDANCRPGSLDPCLAIAVDAPSGSRV